MTLVHVLHHGMPLCAFTTLPPVHWPEHSKWVGLDDPGAEQDVTCDKCRRVMLLMRNKVDTSDIPEAGEDWFSKARRVDP